MPFYAEISRNSFYSGLGDSARYPNDLYISKAYDQIVSSVKVSNNGEKLAWLRCDFYNQFVSVSGQG